MEEIETADEVGRAGFFIYRKIQYDRNGQPCHRRGFRRGRFGMPVVFVKGI